MEKYKCAKCGSEDILIRAWIDPKTKTIEDWDRDECYCHDCEDITFYDIENS